MSRHLSLVKKRSTSTASSSYTQGTRYDDEPCRRLWGDSRPNATQRLYTAAGGVPSKPPMSWLQNPKPDKHSDRPPRRLSAMDSNSEAQSPPQWTGNCWPPAVADRANRTASPSPALFH